MPCGPPYLRYLAVPWAWTQPAARAGRPAGRGADFRETYGASIFEDAVPSPMSSLLNEPPPARISELAATRRCLRRYRTPVSLS